MQAAMKEKAVKRARWVLFLPAGIVVGLIMYAFVDALVRLVTLERLNKVGSFLPVFAVALTGFLSGATATYVGALVAPARKLTAGLVMLAVITLTYGPDVLWTALIGKAFLAMDRLMMIVGSAFVCVEILKQGRQVRPA